MTLRRWISIAELSLALLFLYSAMARAQQITGVAPRQNTGSITATDPGTCTVNNTGCTVIIPGGYTVLSVQFTGTWSATLQFEACMINCGTAINWVPVLLTPPGSTTAVSSVTATNGQWTGSTPANFFRVRASSYTSGTVGVALFATFGPIPSSSLISGGGNCATGATGDVQFSDGSNHCAVDTGIFHYSLSPHLLFVNNVSSNTFSPLLLETQSQTNTISADPIQLQTGSITCGGCAAVYRGGEIDLTTGTADSTDGGSGYIKLKTGDNTDFPGNINLTIGYATINQAGGAINFYSGAAGGGAILGGGKGGAVNSFGGQGGAIGPSSTAGSGGDIVEEAGPPGTGGGVQAVPGIFHIEMPNASDSVVTDCQATDATLSGTLSWSSACGLVQTGSTNLSSAIDSAFGNAQGDILYRGASGWTVLTPGTSGKFLSTGGAAANPSWQSVSATGCTPVGTSILQGNGSGGCSNVAVGTGLTFSGGTLSVSSTTVPLSSLTSASAQNNTLTNGNNYGQIWNWALTSNNEPALKIGETTAATGGSNDAQQLLLIEALNGSTAVPLYVKKDNTSGGDTFRVDTNGNPAFLIDNNGRAIIGGTLTQSGVQFEVDGNSNKFQIGIGTGVIAFGSTAVPIGMGANNSTNSCGDICALNNHSVSLNGVLSAPSSVGTNNQALSIAGGWTGGSSTGVGYISFGYQGMNASTVTPTTAPPAYIGYQQETTTGDTYGDLIFGTRGVTTNTAAIEQLRIDHFGAQIISSTSNTPTVTNTTSNSCGTTAATIAGNEVLGEVTVGATSGTSCTLTFTTTAPNEWICMANDSVTATPVQTVPNSTTTVLLKGAFTAADKIQYICHAR